MAQDVDLSTCDTEPIHLIGAIQPHGALVAVDQTTLAIEFASANTDMFLGHPPNEIIGRPISEIIGDKNADALLTLPLDPAMPELLRPWFISLSHRSGEAMAAECLPHRQGKYIILEFVTPEAQPSSIWEDEMLRRGIISELAKPGALIELADVSAKMIRDVTGFDRVMIYRFAEDKHGEVIAESTNRPDSFLGMHYPASDIPDPARRHFTLNVIRSIPDLNADLIPIIGRGGASADEASENPLDLTYSKLRAVARVHVEYLNNMGVGASLSISLITNNKLWGLVACHHYGKRMISSSRLRFAELLGGTTSALLQSIENTNQLRKSIRAEKLAFQIEQQARDGADLGELIQQHASQLMELIDAQGMILSLNGTTTCIGSVPEGNIDFSALRDQATDGIATSSSMSLMTDMDANQRKNAAGAALMELSDDRDDCLILLRSEFEQTIRWAGKPEKVERSGRDGVKRLSPRGSFALWREERLGQSKPFDAPDRDAFRILRRALFALNSLEHEHAARAAQMKAEEEEIRLRHALLDASRASSMGELASAIAHELNQPLSAVANYVNACRQELINAGVELPERVQQHMNQAVQESSRAGDLIQRIRSFISHGDLKAEYINLNEAIRQGVDLALVASDLRNLRLNLLLDNGLPPVLADRVQIGQVVLNLARNSLTAMSDVPEPELTIEVTQNPTHVMVAVRDTGRGIPEDLHADLFEPLRASTTKGMGIGLSLCRSILEAHSGSIWAEKPETGAEIVFRLPLGENNHDSAD